MLSQLLTWPFARGDTKRLNTVGLTGDLDDVELVMDVEETFGIKLSEQEAQDIRTMGELEALVTEKLEGSFDPVWALLERIARDHSGSREGIDRNTTFFANDATPRENLHG